MLKLFDYRLSGNCYKVRLMLSLLKLEYEIISLDLKKGEHKSPEFLKLNIFGQVPVLVDENTVVRDSQAILIYLARQYAEDNWLPNKAESLALIIQWLFTASHDIQQGLADARAYYLVGRQVNIELATKRSHMILKTIDQHLAQRQWLELNHLTIADISCFPYVAMSRDGKIALDNYSNVIAWIDRIKQLPNYLDLPIF
jgi:glutathione S-transferase